MSAGLGVDLSRYVSLAGSARPFAVEGRVRDVVGVIVGVEGIMAPVGAQLELDLGARTLRLEVLGFRDGRLLSDQRQEAADARAALAGLDAAAPANEPVEAAA